MHLCGNGSSRVHWLGYAICAWCLGGGVYGHVLSARLLAQYAGL